MKMKKIYTHAMNSPYTSTSINAMTNYFKHCLCLFILLLTSTAITYIFGQQSKDTVVFQHSEVTIKFLPDSTYFLYIEPCDICPHRTPGNLYSFGHYYKYKNKTYYLFSDTSLSYRNTCLTKESFVNNDSLTFRFHIPKPNYKNLFSEWAIFCITLYLEPDSAVWAEMKKNFIPFDPYIKTFYTDDTTLTIPKPDRAVSYYKVDILSINTDANFSHAGFSNHNIIKDDNSNVFDIYLPMITPAYFMYERFFSKSVTILDKNAILFNNNVLLRKGVFKPSQYHSPLPKKYRKYVNGHFEATMDYIQKFWHDDEEDE